MKTYVWNNLPIDIPHEFHIYPSSKWFLHGYWGVATERAREGAMAISTSISEPNKVQQFQFETSGILLFTGVQKLCGPEISRFLPYILQFWDNLRRLFIFSYYAGETDHFLLDLLKSSDT